MQLHWCTYLALFLLNGKGILTFLEKASDKSRDRSFHHKRTSFRLGQNVFGVGINLNRIKNDIYCRVPARRGLQRTARAPTRHGAIDPLVNRRSRT